MYPLLMASTSFLGGILIMNQLIVLIQHSLDQGNNYLIINNEINKERILSMFV